MRYYEIVFMIHPDQGEQVSGIIERYKKIVVDSKGIIYRVENWGKRQLAYPIKKFNKAYYALLNVKVSKDVIKELNNSFYFDDFIIRSMIIRTKKAVVKPSPMIKIETDKINI